jgi:uncharacterized protein YdeI (YjbR/CyaY-like superfamily)
VVKEILVGKRSREFDSYIVKSPEYARPILKKLRDLFHEGCPQVEEVMKWSFPHFEYKGIVGSMAAFKNHASLGFWKAKLLKDAHGILAEGGNAWMGGAKITNVSQLPSDKVLLEYIREAAALNEGGVKLPPRPKKPASPDRDKVPDDFMVALKKSKKALAAFESFSPSQKRDYIEWLTSAKQDATRQKRLATAIEWIAEGKPHNWKYMNC